MKYVIITMIICTIAFAQTDTGKVDLTKLVREQIELAQAKQELVNADVTEFNAGDTLAAEIEMPEPEIIKSQVAETFTRQPHVIRRIEKPKSDYSILWKFFVLTAASGMIFGYVFLRRRKKSIVVGREKDLKKKIVSLREERVIRKDNPYLREIRNNLLATAGKGELSEAAITNAARKLRISREEILLANRIHSHTMMNA